MSNIVLILITSALLSAGYCWLLELLHDLYSQNWIWVTVVVGNGFVIGTLEVFELTGVALTIGLVIITNVAWGAPVIAWQIWQAVQRHKQRTPTHKGI